MQKKKNDNKSNRLITSHHITSHYTPKRLPTLLSMASFHVYLKLSSVGDTPSSVKREVSSAPRAIARTPAPAALDHDTWTRGHKVLKLTQCCDLRQPIRNASLSLTSRVVYIYIYNIVSSRKMILSFFQYIGINLGTKFEPGFLCKLRKEVPTIKPEFFGRSNFYTFCHVAQIY